MLKAYNELCPAEQRDVNILINSLDHSVEFSSNTFNFDIYEVYIANRVTHKRVKDQYL